MRTEVGSSMPRPARVIEYRPRERNQVGIAGTHDGLRLLKLGNESNGDHRYGRRPLHGTCERHLIARPDWDLLGWSETATRHVNGGAATRLQRLRKFDCLVNVPAARQTGLPVPDVETQETAAMVRASLVTRTPSSKTIGTPTGMSTSR